MNLMNNFVYVKVRISSSAGLAGDPQKLMVAETVGYFTKVRADKLVNPDGLFGNWRVNRLRKKLIKEIEHMTGRKAVLV